MQVKPNVCLPTTTLVLGFDLPISRNRNTESRSLSLHYTTLGPLTLNPGSCPGNAIKALIPLIQGMNTVDSLQTLQEQSYPPDKGGRGGYPENDKNRVTKRNYENVLGFTKFSLEQRLWASGAPWHLETDVYIAVQPNLQKLTPLTPLIRGANA